MKLLRYSGNPNLKPDPLHTWEALNVFNCGVVYYNNLFHMFYRAQGPDYIRSIGYAISIDRFHFNRFQEPIFSPQNEWETWGVEDPRLTCLENEKRFIMAYTAYSPKGITPMYAESENLYNWKRIGPLVVGEDNKDHVLFPRQIDGRYVTFHRRAPGMWLAYSSDLKTWTDFKPIMGPRPGLWDCKRVGAGGVPIETEHGWLCLYHGYDENHVYRFGVCLLDLEDPAMVLARPEDFIMEPAEPWELKGDVPHAIFSAANPVISGQVYVYYGGADRAIGLATCELMDLLDFALRG
jgi:predicted GH43/DUF377 family glycosyl hydrolase